MNKQEMKLEKVRKSCSTTSKVLSAMRGIAIACVILCIVGAIIIQCFAKDINTEVPKAIAEGKVTFSYTDIEMFNGILNFDVKMQQLVDDGHYAFLFTCYCIAGAVALGIVITILSLFIRIFKTLLENETPFNESVLVKLRSAFIITVVLVALVSGLGEAVFMGLTFWCIYTLIDYGAVLQMEVDETL